MALDFETVFILFFAILGLMTWKFLPKLLAGVPFVEPGDVKRLLDEGKLEVVIDVRTPNEFHIDPGHIPGAVNMPFADIHARLKELGDELSGLRGLPVVVTCATEQRSSHATRVLKKNGFTGLVVLKGGMSAWRKAGLPLETDAPGSF